MFFLPLFFTDAYKFILKFGPFLEISTRLSWIRPYFNSVYFSLNFSSPVIFHDPFYKVQDKIE